MYIYIYLYIYIYNILSLNSEYFQTTDLHFLLENSLTTFKAILSK